MKLTLSFFLLGLTLSGACLASCGPMLISFISGNRKGVWKSLGIYTVFSATRISVYLGLGLLVFFLGSYATESWLKDSSRYVTSFVGFFIVLLGILTALGSRPKSRLCQFLNRQFIEHDHKSVALLGLGAGLIPCAPLVALFGYVALVAKTWTGAIFYVLMFSLGTLFSPLLVLSLLAGTIPRFLGYQKALSQALFSFICGLIMAVLGMQLIIGKG